jgi:hypothetical protein
MHRAAQYVRMSTDYQQYSIVNQAVVIATYHEIERFAQQARALLSNFGNDAVAVKRAEFLQESSEAYESAARTGHSRFRGYGILEATIGTLAWTLTLIVVSLVVRFGTIDPFEIYNKVAGH